MADAKDHTALIARIAAHKAEGEALKSEIKASGLDIKQLRAIDRAQAKADKAAAELAALTGAKSADA